MSAVTRVAAIDCGTNSIRLLIAESSGGVLRDLDRRSEVVRLGQGVDRTGRLDPQALARTLAVTRQYAVLAERAGVDAVRFVATSATRDAANRDEFAAGVLAAVGVEPEVVSGVEEAALSFRGATVALTGGSSGAVPTGAGLSAGGFPTPFTVVDLGGGSTELVHGTDAPQAAVSMDVGSVRLTERHLRTDPPTDAEVAAARADVDAALDAALRAVPVGRTGTLVGLAGSVTSVTAHALHLDRYDRARIDRSVLPVQAVLDAADDLLHRSVAERLALGFMHPGRADVIGAGALVWAQVVRRVVAEVAACGGSLTEVVTSEHDILDGIAMSLVQG